MIYGDPNKIALQFDIVKNWSLEGCSWINGTFAVYIAGKPFILNAENSTLNVIYYYYYSIMHNNNFTNSNNIPTKSEEYYKNIYRYKFDYLYRNIDDSSDYDEIEGFFNITETSLSDLRKYIFIILGKNDVILYGDRVDNNYIVLPQGTFINLIKDMHKYPIFSYKERIQWDHNFHYYAQHEHS